MKKIEFRNLRSLSEKNEIIVKPLTIIVGKNSSGKSTALRTFPLLKQTLEKKTSEPILWYGNYVDFGSFEESLSKNSEEEDITLNYSFNTNISPSFLRKRFNLKPEQNISINLSLVINKNFIKKIIISYEDHEINIELKNKFSLKSIVINDIDINASNYSCHYFSNELIPAIIPNKKNDVYKDIFNEELLSELREINTKKVTNKRLEHFAHSLKIGTKEQIINSIKSYGIKSLTSKIEEGIIKEEDLNKVIAKLIFSRIDILGDVINFYFMDYFSNVSYIAPIRAKAERYYRMQGLSIDSIDPTGDNIAIFLNNLSESEFNFFSEWCKKYFGFEFNVVKDVGHISIQLRNNPNEDFTNLTDTGFGYSQILPIIVLLWLSTRNKKKRKRVIPSFSETITLVIEQPELHLHPALQSKLMDNFIRVINEAKSINVELKIIIETHSKEMVNRVGHHIALKKVNKDDISITIFNRDEKNITTTINGSFDSDGFLENWPIGFFDAEELM